MNLLVLDESLALAVQIGRLASLRGWQPHFVGLLHELEVAVGARAAGADRGEQATAADGVGAGAVAAGTVRMPPGVRRIAAQVVHV